MNQVIDTVAISTPVVLNRPARRLAMHMARKMIGYAHQHQSPYTNTRQERHAMASLLDRLDNKKRRSTFRTALKKRPAPLPNHQRTQRYKKSLEPTTVN